MRSAPACCSRVRARADHSLSLKVASLDLLALRVTPEGDIKHAALGCVWSRHRLQGGHPRRRSPRCQREGTRVAVALTGLDGRLVGLVDRRIGRPVAVLEVAVLVGGLVNAAPSVSMQIPSAAAIFMGWTISSGTCIFCRAGSRKLSEAHCIPRFR